MKYIDAEKLRTEIKRLTYQKKEQLKRFNDEDYSCSVASSINCELNGNEEVLSLIDSLQQEQPEVDLEKELRTYICSDEYMNTRGNGSLLIARHFYELGLNARKEE